MSTVIQVDQLSKQYRLGTVGTGTLSHDVQRLWHKIRGKEDPFLRVGEVNDRTKKGSSDYVWALNDVNFKVSDGEVLGIIGRNGAGKSTLLKILSRTTMPTTGSVKVKGRIASLLEVGTGFHPELSGRENIFLNGAILGMTRQEIARKFDEIVDFSGVERYIDTPVKRYSSGMYVRLAFAVAAHLEPEILIVDEVLAVGDADFQKKALGKMHDVSSGGRTVLFVSHNIAAIKNLCQRCILMQNGQVGLDDRADVVVRQYLENNFSANSKYEHKEGDLKVKVTDIMINDSKSAVIRVFDKVRFDITYKVNQDTNAPCQFFLLISNAEGEYVTAYFEEDYNSATVHNNRDGMKKLTTECLLPPGKYFVSAGIFDAQKQFNDWVEYCESFVVEQLYSDNRIFRSRLGMSVGKGKWED